MALTIAAGGIWAVVETARSGAGSTWRVVTGAGAGLLFWSWIVAGCWQRAHEPEPDPYAPAPVPRSVAFVVANLVLAVVFTALVGGGLWVGVDTARDAERVDRIRHRVEVAARAADVDVAGLRRLEAERQAWMVVSGGRPDPAEVLLPVAGATVVDVVVGDDTAAVLFRPAEGPPCVVLDVDADDLISTRSTTRCS